MYCIRCSYNNPIAEIRCKNCELDLQPPSAPTSSDIKPNVLIYAGFWERFYAAFLDAILIVTVTIFILFIVAGYIALSGRESIIHSPLALNIFCCVFIFVTITYFISMESGSRGATFGKRWMNIKVVGIQGNTLTLSRSLGRFIARITSYLLLLLGLLLQPFTPRKQALHDLLASTIVVKASDSKKISFMASLLVLFFALMLPVLAIFVTAGLPLYRQHILSVQLDSAIQLGRETSLSVSNFYQKNGRVPINIAESGGENTSPHLASIEINQQNGEISMTFSDSVRKAINNKHLLFTPFREADLSIKWKCHSNDIEPQFLPEACK